MKTTEPSNFTLEQLVQLHEQSSQGKFEIYLHRATKWIDWVSSLAGDAKIVGIDPSSKDQLKVSFCGPLSDTETIGFDPGMKFYLKK